MSRGFRHPLFWLLLCSTFYVLFTFTLALSRHYELKSSLMDNGVIMQALWNFWHTGIPTTTIAPPYTGYNWLGFHFSPLVLVLSPLYMLWPKAECLLLIQSLCLASAAIPVYLGSRALGRSERESSLWGALTLCNPFMLNGALWDFHDVALATPLLAWAVYALLRKRFLLMMCFLALLLLCKEHYGVSVAGCGLAWGWRWKEWGKGILLFIAGLGITTSIVGVLMPHLGGFDYAPMLQPNGAVGFTRYEWFHKPLAEMLEMLGIIFLHPATLLYGAFLLAPFWGVMLHAFWLVLPAGADLAANVLTAESMQKSVYAYHSVAIIPVLALASCAGLAALCAKRGLSTAPFLTGMGVVSVFFSVATLLQNPWELTLASYRTPPEVGAVQTLLEPADRLVVQANLGSYFANRNEVYPFPQGMERATVVLLHDAHPYKEENGPFGAPYGVSGWHEYMVSRHQYGIEAMSPHYAQNGWKLYRLAPATPETQP